MKKLDIHIKVFNCDIILESKVLIFIIVTCIKFYQFQGYLYWVVLSIYFKVSRSLVRRNILTTQNELMAFTGIFELWYIKKSRFKKSSSIIDRFRKFRRCLWCNGYHHGKWTWGHEFKSWTRLITFHIALIPLRKV